jgi:hypothetical protein
MSYKGGIDTMSLTNKRFNYMGKKFKTLPHRMNIMKLEDLTKNKTVECIG